MVDRDPDSALPQGRQGRHQGGRLLFGQGFGEFKDHSVRGEQGFRQQPRQQRVQAGSGRQFQRHIQVGREVLGGGEGACRLALAGTTIPSTSLFL